MRSHPNPVVVLSVGLILLAPAVRAQEPAPPADTAAELARLGRSIDRVAALLEETLRLQRAQLTLRRIEVLERRAAPLATQRRSLESQIQDAEAELRELEENAEAERQEIRRQIQDEGLAPGSDLHRQMEDFDRYLRFRQERIDELRDRLVRVELELGEARDEIEDLEAAFREGLDGGDR